VDAPRVEKQAQQPVKLESAEIAAHPEPVVAQPVNIKANKQSGTSVVEVTNHKEQPKDSNPFETKFANPFDFSSSKDDFLFGGAEENLFDYDVDGDPLSFKDTKVNLSILEPKDTFGFDMSKMPFGGDDLFGSSPFPTTFIFAQSNEPVFS